MTLQPVPGSTVADESGLTLRVRPVLQLTDDPLAGQVFVYRPGAPVERLAEPDRVSADPVLPGFRLEMDEIRKILQAEDR